MGRLPVITTLNSLDRKALISILPRPKNAIVKQYKKLFDMDGIDLVFGDDALNAIADKAIERETGARGLRSIMEDTLTNVMFEAPSDGTVTKVTVTADSITKNAEPLIERNPDKKAPRLSIPHKTSKKRENAS